MQLFYYRHLCIYESAGKTIEFIIQLSQDLMFTVEWQRSRRARIHPQDDHSGPYISHQGSDDEGSEKLQISEIVL